MTATEYEINHSPVHVIMSAAAANLWKADLFFSFGFFLRPSCFHSVVYITKYRRKKKGGEWVRKKSFDSRSWEAAQLELPWHYLSFDWKLLMWRKQNGRKNNSWLDAEPWAYFEDSWVHGNFFKSPPCECMCVKAMRFFPVCARWWHITFHAALAFTLGLCEWFWMETARRGDNERPNIPLSYSERCGLRSHWAPLQQTHPTPLWLHTVMCCVFTVSADTYPHRSTAATASGRGV